MGIICIMTNIKKNYKTKQNQEIREIICNNKKKNNKHKKLKLKGRLFETLLLL